MNEPDLALVCDPETHDPLQLGTDALVNPKTGRRYPMREGIPVFIGAVSGPNRKYQKMYDRLAPGYDIADLLGRCYLWLRREKDYREGFIDALELPPAGRVLDVSVGTGLSIPYFSPAMEVHGLDLSWGMLKRCRKNLVKWRRTAALSQGEGERLPFRDDSFDAVLHVGGINFFNDKAKAIREMVRVARPGARIVIVDETEKAVKGGYERNPLIRTYYQGREKPVGCPIDHVPPGMLEVQAEEQFAGRIYRLSFRKPRVTFPSPLPS